ncbi:ribosome-associated translation inhibitor RaiA [Paenibacillus sp. TRM 82003]|uniref:ribosome hibernation-promoting factor, HPF/YfiA family n=1 Tax=Kineococcus sp. TRM81007 TaxID=2925831 RepID=UPI001F58BDA7|nr:ribosome-associated translation inhibitor RaiA [Kineococcus sp. TRM81007]MCI2237891.1 ribosome-associated translation inhibitor RaiA [Kineococcus sp. TRM81007]MCI3924621.1 ribosome-associated translation inhibitor RaiA [Paenibacillus sp. TRM 82003]
MEVVVTGRHTEVKERFRQHVEAKLEKVTQLAPRAQRVDVELSHEKNRRQLASCERVEITVRDKGPVVRAEACADDPYAALDLAATKLMERLRRSRDRRKVHHGRRRPESVRQPAAPGLSDEVLAGALARPAVEPPADLEVPTPAVMADSHPPRDSVDDVDDAADASPVVIREKTHDARPMTLDQALYEMELVGHDFYLFVDAASGCPSVVYRRRGWDYGVIHLDVHEDGAAPASSDGALSAVAGAALR